MNVHLIIDYSFLYYKYKFQLESGKMRRLTQAMEWKGAVIEKDISQIYYSMREIESFRREWEAAGHTVTISVCFDMPSKRKQAHTAESDKYKSNRGSKLTSEDFENIQFVQGVLNTAGYNTYRIDGYEADDIVSFIVRNYKDRFDFNVIYTPDADLLVNIGGNVGAKRYKTGKGYTAVTEDNFSDYLSAELKCNVPFNALMLYKCTVGDKSDCIDGIKKFGPAAFSKLVDYFTSMGANWSVAGNYENTKLLLNAASSYLKPEQLEQAFNSLELVKPEDISTDLIPFPGEVSNYDRRYNAYMPYNMKSLVD